MQSTNRLVRGIHLRSFPVVLLMLVTLGSLYGTLFRFGSVPIWQGFDQMGSFILDASRFWAGEAFYRDFFDLTPPGIECVHIVFFKLFGQQNWIPNADVILCGLLLTGLTAYIGSKAIHTGRFLAVLPAFLFLAFGFLPVIIDSHRWFSSAASYAALAAIMEKRSVRTVAVAGGLCGLASFFTQTQGPVAVAGIVAFLCWEKFREKSGWEPLCRKIALVIASFALVFFLTTAYFLWSGGVHNFWVCLYEFPAKYAPLARNYDSIQVYLSEFPRGQLGFGLLNAQARYILIHTIVPLVYVVSVVMYWREGLANERGAQTILLAIMGLFFSLGVAPSPSYFRLCSVSAPAMVLLVLWLEKRSALGRLSIGILWAVTLFTLVRFPVKMQTAQMKVLNLPRGPFAFSDSESVDYQILNWLASQTRPGMIFFSAGETGLFYPLGLRPIDKTTGYDNTGFTRVEDVEDAIASINKYRPKLIEWPPDATDPKYYHPDEDHLAPLILYVQANYHPVYRFTDTSGSRVMEIWQKNK